MTPGSTAGGQFRRRFVPMHIIETRHNAWRSRFHKPPVNLLTFECTQWVMRIAKTPQRYHRARRFRRRQPSLLRAGELGADFIITGQIREVECVYNAYWFDLTRITLSKGSGRVSGGGSEQATVQSAAASLARSFSPYYQLQVIWSQFHCLDLLSEPSNSA